MYLEPQRYEGLERERLSEAKQEILMAIVSGQMEPEVDDGLRRRVNGLVEVPITQRFPMRDSES